MIMMKPFLALLAVLSLPSTTYAADSALFIKVRVENQITT
jgi:hypothetical protein